ncbi:unnamed protein product [Rotaria socialis]|uniref:Uncharacterized protein n=1 Tax=Rotaria socialis TaxID=392032 RepID=A0A821QM66_9BILA|nr:unnamed protein product [Rotaria socialis]CAF4823781.1 unnamed protein product [Rotaria socialis]
MQKVVVIPHSLFTKWQDRQKENDKHDKRLANLEANLNKILKSGKADDFKKVHYVEALRKFLQEHRKIDDDVSDIKLEIEEKNQANLSNDHLYNSLKNKITGSNLLKKGQSLYKLLSNSPDIDWTNNGMVTLHGSLIAGSNIDDLIAGALDQTYSDRNPTSPGKDAFEKFVRRLKGGRYSMTRSAQQIAQQAVAAPSQSQIIQSPVTQAPVTQAPVTQRASRGRSYRGRASSGQAYPTNIYKKQYKENKRSNNDNSASATIDWLPY